MCRSLVRARASKICLITSESKYPAFNSVSLILNDIFGEKNIIDLKYKAEILNNAKISKIFLYIYIDLMLSLKIISVYNEEHMNFILFFQCHFPLSFLVSKLLKLKLISYIGGSHFYWSYLRKRTTLDMFFAYTNLPIQKICYKLSNILITLSPNMINIIGLENYISKTMFALPRLDKKFYKEFKIVTKYENRNNIVGFVGLICRRKGIINLIHAIRYFIKDKSDYKFLLIGKGPLLEIIKTEIKRLGLSKFIIIKGFVNYDDLKKYYNEMKLYVLPSYAEGIPSTIFEAMASGTPILTTSVGGIADVIKEGETGFLLKSNDPKYIAKRMIKLLDNPTQLQKVSSIAYEFSKENFSYRKTLDAWRKIFSKSAYFNSKFE